MSYFGLSVVVILTLSTPLKVRAASPASAPASRASALRLELRDDSGRLKLDSDDKGAALTQLARKAREAGIDVQQGEALQVLVIAEGDRCRVGLLQRRRGRLERALSSTIRCDTAQVVAAAGRLMKTFASAKGPPSLRARAHQVDAERAVLAAAVAKPQQQGRRRLRLAVDTGFQLFSRSFSISDPVTPVSVSSYESGTALSLSVGTEVYPLAWITNSALAGIGLGGRFSTSVGLTSKIAFEKTDNSLWRLEGDLRYRWQLWDHPYVPDLVFSVGLGLMRFEIDADPLPLPNIRYSYLRLGLLALEQPLYVGQRLSVVFGGQLAYLIVFGAGEIEASDSSGFGAADIGGVDLGASLRVSYASFYASLGLSYRRFFYTFDRLCAIEGQGCAEAGGALEEITDVTVLFGYRM